MTKPQVMPVRVEQMYSPRSRRPVANQFIIETPEGFYFQSYNTVIAFKGHDGRVLLDEDWNYSMTTSKYRSKFLREGLEETRRKIRENIYQIVDLNNRKAE